MADNTIQIDVKVIGDTTTVCSMNTGSRDVLIFMQTKDYEALQSDGFFIRPGIKPDSANILNTTQVYKTQ